MTRAYDIVMVTDCRFPGGTSASLAEEITAQAAAGYSTGIVHVPGPFVNKHLPFNSRIQARVREGAAEVIVGDEPVRARLLVMRHPAVFTEPPPYLPPIEAERRLMVVNQAPEDTTQPEPHFDVAGVAANVEDAVGPGVVWAPIGPLVRQSLRDVASPVEVLDWDWHNVVDVDYWAVDRTHYVADRPVIGRHSRPSFRKWPDDPDELLAAYPDDGSLQVRILGGAKVPGEILGGVPRSWRVDGFDAIAVRDFLAGIDFFVYFHHPGWVEAFGRATLEAMASGAVAVLPPHFEPLFADAAVYTQPGGVRETVGGLYADKAAYDAQSRRGQSYVRERFSHETHARRIADLIGEPSAPPVAKPAAVPRARPRVLFVSSNGAGVGHLMRLLAMATRAREDLQPVFFPLSSAVPVARQAGFPVEHLPSRAYSGLPTREWNPLFRRRLGELIRAWSPVAVVFDGTWPYAGLVAAREDWPGLPWVWSRRGMWKPDQGHESLERAWIFQLIIEPGEFAHALDRGLTAAAGDEVVRVPPITYVGEEDLLDRAEARAALGLDPDRPAALVGLGAGNINDITSLTATVLRRLVKVPDLQVCATQSIIAGRSTPLTEAVVPLSIYPLARYYRAFDFAVSAAGYNSYHELIGFGVPTIFFPNTATAADDQLARARYAHEVGCAFSVEDEDEAAFEAAVDALLHEDRRAAMAARCRELYPGNGARDAMAAVEALIDREARP